MKTPLSQKLEDGFALPIAIGVGVVMILIATTMVIRSNQSQVASISQRSNHNSLAAAETGIAQYLALFNRYRAFASSKSIDWDDRRIDMQARPSCAGGSANPDYGATNVNSFFTTSAEGNWVDIDSDPEKGRFQLIEYDVNENLNLGSLTIEGADGRNPEALTRLDVEFPLLEVSVSPVAPGSSTTDCIFAAMDLPITNSLNSFVSSENNDVLNVSFSDSISSSIAGNTTFPRAGDPSAEHYTYVIESDPAINLNAGDTLTVQNGKTVYLVTEEDISVTGGQINLESGAKLFIISAGNVTLTQQAAQNRPVIYSEEVNQPAASEAFQVFLTGIDADPSTLGNTQGELVLEVDNIVPPSPAAANDTRLSFVAYVPDGSVSLTNNNLTAVPPNTNISVEGSVWAKNFAASPSLFTSQGVTSPDLSVFWKARLDTTRLSKRLGSINSWKKTDS